MIVPPLPPLSLLLPAAGAGAAAAAAAAGWYGRGGDDKRGWRDEVGGGAGVLVHRRIDPWNSWGRRRGSSVCPPCAKEREKKSRSGGRGRMTGWRGREGVAENVDRSPRSRCPHLHAADEATRP